MKYFGIIIVILVALASSYYFFQNKTIPTQTPTSQNTPSSPEDPHQTILAQNLDTPWALAFLPDKSILLTERAGRVQLIDTSGNLSLAATISSAKEIGEGGLLGITIHPQVDQNNFVYLYYTYSGNGSNTFNRVVRMTLQNKNLTDEQIILDAIPGNSNHNGGRIKFGPDNMLYIGTGDAGEPSQSQDTKTLAGKILRVTDEGKPAPGNPFGNEVYSYGHRNVQGLTWDGQGKLWATEHGRSGIQSGLDELNLIESGKNYGWPDIQGNETRPGMETAKRNSGSTTWAPAGLTTLGDSLFFGGLRGQTLYQAIISGTSVTELKDHFPSQLGRIREVITGPDGMLYITTSNRDGRGTPHSFDDKVIRLNPAKL